MAVITVVDGRVTGANAMAERLLLGDAGGPLVGTDFADLATDRIDLSVPSGPEPMRTTVRRLDGTPLRADLRWGVQGDATTFIIDDATARYEIQDDLLYGFVHDPLTDLPNRLLAVDRVEQALNRLAGWEPTWMGLMSIELDGFNRLAHASGQPLADPVVMELSHRLTNATSRIDTVARWDNDQFMVIIESARSETELAARAELLLDLFREPIDVHGRTVRVSASIGLALLNDATLGVDEVIELAHQARCAAAAAGGDRIEIAEPHLHRGATQRVALEESLRRALDDDQIEVQFQPVMSASTGTIRAVEALARWRPGGAWVSPSEFIPVAEEAGLLGRVGEAVLRRSLRELRVWRAAGVADDVVVSINLALSQLTESMPGDLAAAVEAAGLSPGDVVIELAEGAFTEDDWVSREVLARLRSHGFLVAVDNLGAGSASLASIFRFAPDVVKIDGTVVRNLTVGSADRALVQSILDLAGALGLDVVAEGIETPLQAAVLSDLGCDLLQGFHIHRPMVGAEVMHLLFEEARTTRGAVDAPEPAPVEPVRLRPV